MQAPPTAPPLAAQPCPPAPGQCVLQIEAWLEFDLGQGVVCKAQNYLIHRRNQLIRLTFDVQPESGKKKKNRRESCI